MSALAILIISDGRPGHYHLSDGVAAAIGRRVPVSVTRLEVERRQAAAGRLLAAGLRLGLPPALVLVIGYGTAADALPPADLVISAGGDTLAANVAASRLLGAPNIFCGTLRHMAPEAFSLVISSYARHATLPRHLVALKPNGLDPDSLPPRAHAVLPGPGRPPRTAGLLVGGPSGLFHWQDHEWRRLVAFLAKSHRAHGTHWIVSTSRRTPESTADLLQQMAADRSGPIAELIDFRHAGAGTLPRLFAGVEAVLVTEDSSTMMSEAVCARLPVVGVAPGQHSFKDEEREYRAYLTSEGWCRSLALDALSPETFLAALGEVRPLAVNHLDRLSSALTERLPELFRKAG
jgi:mitochondrial fission protein ELM1